MTADPVAVDAPESVSRVQPNDVDAERSVLGAMMLDKQALVDCQDVLRGPDFYRPAHETIFDAICRLDVHRQRVDPITVFDELRRTGDGARVGGAPYLHQLVADLPTAANAAYYAGIVKRAATRRRLVEAGTRIAQLGYSTDGADVDELVEVARAEVDGVPHAVTGVTVLGDEIDATLDRIEAGPLPAVATPWPDLNQLIRGWQPGRLYLVGARPNVGKSILLGQAALDLAEQGWVSLHTLEMSREEVHSRIIASSAHVSLRRLEESTLSEGDWRRIADARNRWNTPRLVIDDRSSVRVVDIRAMARTLARKGPLAGICVDYLQLMGGERGDRRSREQQVSDWSRELKVLAKDLAVPVIVACQLNRNPEARSDRRPTMADLRESGALEQNADVILLLHVDDDPRDDNADPDLMHVLVAKQRNGPKGALRLRKVGEQVRLDPWVFPSVPRPPVLAGPRPRDFIEPPEPPEDGAEPIERSTT